MRLPKKGVSLPVMATADDDEVSALNRFYGTLNAHRLASKGVIFLLFKVVKAAEFE